MFRTAAIVVLSFSLSGLPAFAADKDAQGRTTLRPTSKADAASGAALAGDVDWSLPPVNFGGSQARPRVLPALYTSLAALQAFDAYSTTKGVPLGAREANPLMRGAASKPAVFWALKAGTTVLPMMAAERMWKKNRVGAVVVMALANGLAVAVAANNAKVLGRQK